LINNATAYLLAQSDPTAVTPAFDTAESDIRPRPLPSFDSPGQPTSAGAAADRPMDTWQWFAAAALVVLGLEWLTFARRG
jgi:hypothetical protein